MNGGETVGDRRMVQALRAVEEASTLKSIRTDNRTYAARRLRQLADRIEPKPDKWIGMDS